MRRAIAGGTVLIGIGLATSVISGSAGAQVLPPVIPNPPSLPALPQAPVPVPTVAPPSLPGVPAPAVPKVSAPTPPPAPAPSGGGSSGSARSVAPAPSGGGGGSSPGSGGGGGSSSAGGSWTGGSTQASGSGAPSVWLGAREARRESAAEQRRSRKVRRIVRRHRGCLPALPRAERRVLLLRAALRRERPRARNAVAGRLHVSVRRVAKLERRGLELLTDLAARGRCGEQGADSPSAPAPDGSGAGSEAGSGSSFLASGTGAEGDAAAGPAGAGAGEAPGGAAPGEGDDGDGGSSAGGGQGGGSGDGRGEVRGEQEERGDPGGGSNPAPLAGRPLEIPTADQSPFLLLLAAVALLLGARVLWGLRRRRRRPQAY